MESNHDHKAGTHGDHGHATDHGNSQTNDQEKRIAREMLPYFIHIIWPVLIIVIIWKIYAPKNF